MLGSHFDLDKKIAQIASKRAAEQGGPPETRSEQIRAYSDFDRRLSDFVRAVGDDGGITPRDADAGSVEPSRRDPNAAGRTAATTATLSSLAAVRKAAGSLSQIR